MLDLHTEPAACPGCGTACEAVRFGGMLRYLCDSCAAASRARRRLEERRGRCLELWREVTPPDFQSAIRADLLHPALRPALTFSGTEGAALIGPAGAGKTRLGYLLLRRAAAAGLKPYAITQSLFRRCVAERTSDEPLVRSRARERLHAAHYAQALLLDDIGKGACSEASDEALFELLTYRRDHRLVTHWTANHAGQWIAGRYGADRGPAIAIRLANLAGCFARGTGRICKAEEPAGAPAADTSQPATV